MGLELSRIRISGKDEFRANNESGTENSSHSRTSVLRHHYHQLHRAAVQENWKDTAQVFNKCHQPQHAADAKKWALHFAMRTGKANDYLKHLLDYLEIDDLKIEENGKTALSIAATMGNVDVVKLLLEKDPKLPYEWTTVEQWPLNVAARYGNKEMVSFLLNEITYPQGSNYEDPCKGEFAQFLLENLINSALYGVALEVVKRYSSNRLTSSRRLMCNLLTLLANQPYAFRSTSSVSRFQHLIYFMYTTGLQMSNLWKPNIQVFLPNQYIRLLVNYWWYQYIIIILKAPERAWNAMEKLVYWLIKEVQEIKLMHDQATELAKSLCELLRDINYNEVEANFKEPFLLAAEHGIMEIVQQILDVSPSAIDLKEGEDNILVLAVKNRNEAILCLKEYLDKFKEMAENFKDEHGNNILHIAGRLTPEDKLNSISNPDFQLWSKSNWFEKIGELVADSHHDMKNNEQKTPMTIFEEQHKELLTEGEKWMKNIAKPCINVALLITGYVSLSMIVLFDYDILSEDDFIVVLMAESLALFFSLIALSIFAAILIFSNVFSNAYRDFHRIFRRSLLYGLGALCLSIFFTIIAVAVTLYIEI